MNIIRKKRGTKRLIYNRNSKIQQRQPKRTTLQQRQQNNDEILQNLHNFNKKVAAPDPQWKSPQSHSPPSLPLPEHMIRHPEHVERPLPGKLNIQYPPGPPTQPDKPLPGKLTPKQLQIKLLPPQTGGKMRYVGDNEPDAKPKGNWYVKNAPQPEVKVEDDVQEVQSEEDQVYDDDNSMVQHETPIQKHKYHQQLTFKTAHSKPRILLTPVQAKPSVTGRTINSLIKKETTGRFTTKKMTYCDTISASMYKNGRWIACKSGYKQNFRNSAFNNGLHRNMGFTTVNFGVNKGSCQKQYLNQRQHHQEDVSAGNTVSNDGATISDVVGNHKHVKNNLHSNMTTVNNTLTSKNLLHNQVATEGTSTKQDVYKSGGRLYKTTVSSKTKITRTKVEGSLNPAGEYQENAAVTYQISQKPDYSNNPNKQNVTVVTKTVVDTPEVIPVKHIDESAQFIKEDRSFDYQSLYNWIYTLTYELHTKDTTTYNTKYESEVITELQDIITNKAYYQTILQKQILVEQNNYLIESLLEILYACHRIRKTNYLEHVISSVFTILRDSLVSHSTAPVSRERLAVRILNYWSFSEFSDVENRLVHIRGLLAEGLRITRLENQSSVQQTGLTLINSLIVSITNKQFKIILQSEFWHVIIHELEDAIRNRCNLATVKLLDNFYKLWSDNIQSYNEMNKKMNIKNQIDLDSVKSPFVTLSFLINQLKSVDSYVYINIILELMLMLPSQPVLYKMVIEILRQILLRHNNASNNLLQEQYLHLEHIVNFKQIYSYMKEQIVLTTPMLNVKKRWPVKSVELNLTEKQQANQMRLHIDNSNIASLNALTQLSSYDSCCTANQNNTYTYKEPITAGAGMVKPATDKQMPGIARVSSNLKKNQSIKTETGAAKAKVVFNKRKTKVSIDNFSNPDKISSRLSHSSPVKNTRLKKEATPPTTTTRYSTSPPSRCSSSPHRHGGIGKTIPSYLKLKKDLSNSIKTTTKHLHWEPVYTTDIRKQSIWTKLNETTELNTETIEHIINNFGDANQIPQNNQKHVILTEQDAKEMKCILETMSISLNETTAALKTGSISSKMTTKDLQVLTKKILSQKVLLQKLKIYNNSKKPLSLLEKSLRKLSKIRNLDQRTQCLTVKIQWKNESNAIRSKIQTINSIFSTMITSKSLQQIIGTVLNVGNVLNTGTKHERSYAYHIKYLTELKNVNTSDNSKNLMDFLVEVLLQHFPDTINFLQEFSNIEEAVKYANVVDHELDDLKKQTETIKYYLSISTDVNDFNRSMIALLEKCKEDITIVENDCKMMNKLYEKVGEYFTLPKHTYGMVQCLTDMRQFWLDYQLSWYSLNEQQSACNNSSSNYKRCTTSVSNSNLNHLYQTIRHKLHRSHQQTHQQPSTCATAANGDNV